MTRSSIDSEIPVSPEILGNPILFLYNSVSAELIIHLNRRFPFLRQYLSDPRTHDLVSIRLGGMIYKIV